MVRITEDIYQEMLAEKQSRPELAPLSTTSNTGMWQMWLRFIAQLIHWQEEKQDAFKIEVQQIVDSAQFGTFDWWTAKVKSFQFGDMLQFISNRYQYAALDASKQIVHYVSVSDERGLVKIKAAKIANSRPAPLSDEEANGLLSYCRELRPPGVRLVVESLPADKLITRLRIHYNGQIALADIQQQVEDAYVNYINNIIFDGVYYVNRMIDALQVIPGVIDEQVEVLSIQVQQGSDPLQSFTTKYQAKSGYFEVESTQPLSSTIEYIAI